MRIDKWGVQRKISSGHGSLGRGKANCRFCVFCQAFFWRARKWCFVRWFDDSCVLKIVLETELWLYLTVEEKQTSAVSRNFMSNRIQSLQSELRAMRRRESHVGSNFKQESTIVKQNAALTISNTILNYKTTLPAIFHRWSIFSEADSRHHNGISRWKIRSFSKKWNL